MNNLIVLENFLKKGKKEVNFVRNLYFVMDKVGGYEQLMRLSMPALNEIMKCIEWEGKEREKASRRKN